MLGSGPPPDRNAVLLPRTQRYCAQATLGLGTTRQVAKQPVQPQADLLSGTTSDDAFAELVRLAVQRDPSLAQPDTSSAARAASSAAGPPPDTATGAVRQSQGCQCLCMM